MIAYKYISLILFLLSILCIGCYYPAFYNQFLIAESFTGPIICMLLSIIWFFILSLYNCDGYIMPKKEYTYILGIIALYLLFRIFVFDEASSIGYLNTIIVTWVLVFLNINSFTTEQYMVILN